MVSWWSIFPFNGMMKEDRSNGATTDKEKHPIRREGDISGWMLSQFGI